LQQIPKPQKSKDELLRTQRKKVLLNSRNGLRECGSQRPNAPLFPPIPKGSQPLAGGKRSATSGQPLAGGKRSATSGQRYLWPPPVSFTK
jgi:hypothetical protein